MKKLYFKLCSIIFLVGICSIIIASSNTTVFAEKAEELPCCNVHDPRYYVAAKYTYDCYQNGVIVNLEVTYDCCWDAWKNNGWVAPVYQQCQAGECIGPGEDF